MEGMYKILTSLQRSSLLALHRKERDGRVRDRIKAVLLYDDGWTPTKIAQALLIEESTVRDHIKTYEKEERLTLNYQGSQPILTEKETMALSNHLETRVYVKIKDIQAYVKGTFGKEMGISTLYAWLTSNGFSYKKPKLVPKNADPVKQEAFKVLYNKIMKEAALEGEPVLFGDSVHPSQQTRPSYGWIKRGKDKPLETTGARKRVNLMGVLNLETMRFGYKEFDTINGEATVTFLKEVEKMYPDSRRIHLILDQAGYHTAQETKDFLKRSRIKVYYLPARSPNLNPIERLWKIMHEYVSNNRVYERFKDFKKSLFDFFNNTMPNIKDILVSRITDNFQTLPGN
jgi:transposase